MEVKRRTFRIATNFNNIECDADGWINSDDWRPTPFDLCEFQTEKRKNHKRMVDWV